jgi:hypothetical protein
MTISTEYALTPQPSFQSLEPTEEAATAKLIFYYTKGEQEFLAIDPEARVR